MAPAARAQWHYYYFDQERPLTADSSRIAVFSPAGGVAASGALAGFTVTPWHAAGWSLAAPQGGVAASDLEQLVASVAETVPFASPVFLDKYGEPLIVTPNILVGFNADVDARTAERVLRNAGAGVVTRRRLGGMAGVYRLRSDLHNGFEVLSAINDLAQRPEVRFAEPDVLFTGHSALVPTDPLFPDAWALDNTGQFDGTPGMDLGAVEAWNITTGDDSIIVVVIDSGVDQAHPELHQLTPGTDTTSNPSTDGGPVSQYDDHGTAVAGCISGLLDNGIGAVGIAPDCRVASARTFITFNSSGQWTSEASWTVDSLAWAESIGARVTNNSNCYGFQSAAIDSKYDQTRASGMVHFASSCNEGVAELGYPSLLPTVNAIGAITPSGQRATFSNIGNGLAYVAPGVDIVTTDRVGSQGYDPSDFVYVQGTSFSSPFVAGVAALFLSRSPDATPDEVETALTETAVDVDAPGYDIVTGWGLVSAAGALLWRPECYQPEQIHVDAGSGAWSRFASFTPPQDAGSAALRITAENLAPPYDIYNGESWWIGPPQLTQGNVTEPTSFMRSTLQCTPAFVDWGTIDVLYITGTQIIPGSSYSVTTVLQGCDGPDAFPSYTSQPVGFSSAPKWGDVAPPYQGDTAALQPDFLDIAAMVEAFLDTPGCPSILHADLYPASPDFVIDFHDIGQCVEGFLGVPYQLGPPEVCP